MKLYCSHYTLGTRVGALLRVHFSENLIGYADCHPWPTLGDDPLEYQLKNPHTPLMERSLAFAKLDAEARCERKSLLAGLLIPKSHLLITREDDLELALEEGFSHVKVKIGRDFSTLFRWMDRYPTLRFRLDGSNQLLPPDLEAFKTSLQIDFCEDPYLFDKSWFSVKIPLAADRQKVFDSHFLRIIKPAVDQIPDLPSEKMVVTTYLGHPLGQMADAYVAATLKIPKLCGLLSHRAYPKNRFSEQLNWLGPNFTVPAGTGFGFDELLAALPWRVV